MASKVTSLAAALTSLLRPGMTVHLSPLAVAAVYELVRASGGKPLGLTLSMSTADELHLILVHRGLVDRLITSLVSASRPSPGPSAIFQRATASGALQVEFWSFLTLYLRYMAGALGLPFLPTNSILGSSLEQELAGNFLAMEDPFGSGRSVGLVKALRPDLAIVHALAADHDGNAIPVPHQSEDVWAARASRGGAVVLAEQIVPVEALADYAPLVKIPGFVVQALCAVPFGAHPRRLFSRSIPWVEGYAEDGEFLVEQRTAAREGPEALDRWIHSWVLGVASHQEYLDRLGASRLSHLKSAAMPKPENGAATTGVSPTDPRIEAMVVAGGRRIAEVAQRGGYRVMLVGTGTGALASFLGYHLLEERGYEIQLALGGGSLGFRPYEANISSFHHLRTARILGDTLDIYGSFLRGQDSMAMAVMGMAQIDRHGNVNSTRLADGAYMTGPGGGNDCVMGAGEVVVIGAMSPKRFVPRVSHVSSPGRRVRIVVTDRGVLEKRGRGDELVLSTYYPSDGKPHEQILAEIRTACGWDLSLAPDLSEEPLPTQRELEIIRSLDRRGAVLRSRDKS